MSTLKFTTSVMVAIEFVLKMLKDGGWRPRELSGRIARITWAYRFHFFSEIRATPIQKSEKESETAPGIMLTKLEREVSFYRHGHLFITLTLSGYSFSSSGQELDNHSSWGVKKIRYATEWVGSMVDPEPKDWVEFDVVGEPQWSGVL